MKYLIPSSLLLLMSSLSLCADEVAQTQSQSSSQPSGPYGTRDRDGVRDRDPCCPAPKPCCPPRPDCIPPKCAQIMGGPKGEILPNAGPCIACGADLYFTADFIYWTVREEHLGYALTLGNQTAATASAPAHGKISQLDFKMKPGFKVGVGMLFDHDGWDVFAEYTWIRARNITGSVTNTPGTTYIIDTLLWEVTGAETTVTTAGVGGITSVSGAWQLHYFNVIDLELGRNFYVSRYLMLRPHFGFKGTWQKQFFDVTVNGLANGTTAGSFTTGNSITSTMKQEQFYWGFGIRAGLDAAFHFSRSFSTFGEIAVAGLYGQFEENRLGREFNNSTGAFIAVPPFSPVSITDNFHTIKPVMEWQVGLRWEMYTCDWDFHFAFEAAWEEQYWLGQNQFINYLTETRGGDLSFQGLTLKFRFDF
ncbi:MAG TPA: Lpg1974 family pore-forming outer membrane protein [Rhabdochlamydiaceae bacterium]|nr:Lpg1974 family pore-forming outer membrane protein [Rhabdochlamydiaceae bacterium]